METNYDESRWNHVDKIILKTDMYPDPLAHITTTILEYPRRCEDLDDFTGLKKTKVDKKRSRKNNLRYMTQPVTLLEIREADEEIQQINNDCTKTNQQENNSSDSALNNSCNDNQKLMQQLNNRRVNRKPKNT
jgi:hypothetical protein